MFCGEGNGKPSYGDAGGGFFAVVEFDWVQFGILSHIHQDEFGNALNVAGYTKLTSFTDWIAESVAQSGDEISVAKTKVNLKCAYGYTSAAFYGCWLFDLNLTHKYFEVKNFTGSHDLDKVNEHVELIAFKTGVTVALPHNFGKIFKNLKFLLISVETKRLSRSNLQSLKRLEMIGLVESNIAELDGDSLWDLPNLQSFEVDKSKLKMLHEATFSRNHKLTVVQVLSSKLKSLPSNLFRENVLLESVSFLKGKFSETSEQKIIPK